MMMVRREENTQLTEVNAMAKQPDILDIWQKNYSFSDVAKALSISFKRAKKEVLNALSAKNLSPEQYIAKHGSNKDLDLFKSRKAAAAKAVASRGQVPTKRKTKKGTQLLTLRVRQAIIDLQSTVRSLELVLNELEHSSSSGGEGACTPLPVSINMNKEDIL